MTEDERAKREGTLDGLKEEVGALAGECEGIDDARQYLGGVVEDMGCTLEEATEALRRHYGRAP